MIPFPGISLIDVQGQNRPQIGHALDPRYLRVHPGEIHTVVERLASTCKREEVDCVLGLVEGSYLPAFVFSQVIDRPVVLSTRCDLCLPGKITFREPHSCQYSTQYVFGLSKGDRAIIVEDEITTGVTIVNAVNALRNAGIRINQVFSLLAVDAPAMWRKMDGLEIEVIAGDLLPGVLGSQITQLGKQ